MGFLDAVADAREESFAESSGVKRVAVERHESRREVAVNAVTAYSWNGGTHNTWD